MAFSLFASSEFVASSKKRNFASLYAALAMRILCFYPVLSP